MASTRVAENPHRQKVLNQMKERLPHNVQFVEGEEKFYVKRNLLWEKQSGLRKRMEKVFFCPPSSKRMAMLKRARQKNKQRLASMNDRDFNAFRLLKRESRGISRGRQVHEEIELYCKNPESFNKAVKESTDYIFKLALAKKARDHPRSIPRGPGVAPHLKGIDPPPPARVIHSVTQQIIKKLADWKLTPIMSEVPIFDDEANYATSIDLVCVSHTGKIWIIELKTGYDHIVKSATRKMNGFMGKYLNNSALGQALLQIFIPMCTMRHKYGIRARAAVVVANSEGVKMQPVPEEMKINSEELYEKIKAAMKK